MNVLIISPLRTVAPHFETELEIAQRHIEAGDEVTFLSCLGELDACDFNPGRDPDKCEACRLRRQHGLTRLTTTCRSAGMTPLGNAAIPAVCLQSPQALRQWKIQNFDIGYACLSSLVSLTRDPQPDLAKHRDQLERLARAALATWNTTLGWLTTRRPDRVYVFNGRFAATRAVLRACQLAKINCYIHERGCDTRHFQLYRNHLPHDIDQVQRRMRHHWNRQSANPRRDQLARAWYRGRVARVETNWHSFVRGQTHGQLPDSWNSRRHNIAVYTSSEDEFVAIGDCWQNRLYPDQSEALNRIAVDLETTRPDAHLTIRVHPNLAGVDNASTRALQGLNRSNVTLIDATARIDSYQLMRAADTVVTFGSTMGMESVYWSRPSVLLGPCFYQSLRGTYQARSHGETLRLLTADLMPRFNHDALLYGYWMQTHGIGFTHFQADGLFTGTFRGETVYPKPPRTLGRRMARQVHSLGKRLPVISRRRAA